jgi:hypothetical protein
MKKEKKQDKQDRKRQTIITQLAKGVFTLRLRVSASLRLNFLTKL